MQPARMIVSGKWQQQVFTVNLGLFGLYRQRLNAVSAWILSSVWVSLYGLLFSFYLSHTRYIYTLNRSVTRFVSACNNATS